MSELLLGDDPPPPKGRPRWVDGLGLAAIVAGMLAIGVLGDRGSRDEATRPPATTTTTARAPRRLPSGPATTTPATVPPPLAVGRPLTADTGTVLLLQGQETTQVYDVDAGMVRRLRLSQSGFPAFGVPGGFLLGGRRELELLPLGSGKTTSFSLELRGSSWPVGVSSRGVWVQGPGGLLEVGFDGRPTGRHHELPASAYPAGVLERGLVVAQYDSLTLLEPDGERRSLGHGVLWGHGGDTVAVVTCELLACELRALDIRTGAVRTTLDLGAEAGQLAEPGQISPDGRWLVYRSLEGQVRGLVAVDLDTGGVRSIPSSGEVATWAFARQGSLLFAASNNDLAAYDLVTDTWTPLAGVPVGGTMAMTATGA